MLLYSLPDRGDYAGAVGRGVPRVVQTYVRRVAGESVAWNAAGSGFYTLPEGRHPTFHFYGKKAAGDVPIVG